MGPSDYVDKWGTFDKKFMPDGGDSLHRVFFFWSLAGMMGFIKQAEWSTKINQKITDHIKIHKVHQGNYVRHPNKDWDASDFDRMSRDQLKPLVVALGYWDRKELKDFTIGHLKRGFLFCNNTRQNGANKFTHGTKNYDYSWRFPDVTGPDVWALFIRAWKAWPLYPLLLLFDIYLIVTAIKWRWFPKHNIALNSTLSLMQAIHRLPTPLSWLASKTMPVPKLIEICREHLNDQYVAMPFLADMMRDAWEELK